MPQSRSNHQAVKIAALTVAFFALSGAWVVAGRKQTAVIPASASGWTWQFSPPAAVASKDAISKIVPSGIINPKSADKPLINGPPMLSWSEGNDSYRAAHYISLWNPVESSWQAISPNLTESDLEGAPGYGIDGITAVAHRGTVWYVGTLAGQLCAKRDEDWRILQGALPSRTITGIALPRGDSTGERAVVVYGGYGTATPDNPGHVYLTTDGGSSWTNVTGNLPDAPVGTVHFVTGGKTAQQLVVEISGTWYRMQKDGDWTSYVPSTPDSHTLISRIREWL